MLQFIFFSVRFNFFRMSNFEKTLERRFFKEQLVRLMPSLHRFHGHKCKLILSGQNTLHVLPVEGSNLEKRVYF